jgi:simple sugar transport system permease protein
VKRLVALEGPLAAIAIALGAGAVLIGIAGENPLEIYALMATECFGTPYGIGQVLFKATPLIFTGLGVALAFRGGLFNIGAEGQLVVGGLAAGLAGAALTGQAPFVALPACLAAAAGAGALWGAIPGMLRARFGAHEVINTIMLNFVAFALVAWIGRYAFEPATVRTAEITAGAVLPRLDVWFPALAGSPANFALVLALLAAIVVGIFLDHTRLGYEIRAVGLNAAAAEFAGIGIGATRALTLALSGALAGLGGANFVLGYKHFFEQGFSAGAGFLGIAVALVGRNQPLGVVLAALFFGALSYSGLVIHGRVPKELVDMLQGLVLLIAIAVPAALARRRG